MPEMTENQLLLRRTHRKKNRETHNAVERHRKKKINSGINKIGELIPCSPALKQSKNMILDQAYKYISELKRQNDEILLNGGTKEQAEEIVRLRKQLDDLQKENDRFVELLKANDICLHDDPTIHWKRKFKGTKTTMMISPNQVQEDILIYTNGNQLNGNCHQATVQSSPELTLNTLKNTTQEACLDIMMPMAIPDIGQVANGIQPQTRISQRNIPECLPTTQNSLNAALCTTTMGTVQSVLNVSTNSSGPVLLQCPISTSAQLVLECSQTTFGRTTSEVPSGCPVLNIAGTSANTCPALPLPLQQMGSMCMGVESPQQTVLGSTSSCNQSSEFGSTKWPVSECPQGMMVPNVCRNSPVSARGLPPPFKAGTMCQGGLVSSCPITSLWTVSCPASTYACAADTNSLGAFTCMTFAGNTRTTWTTLQLAGNTVQPVSQVNCSALPTTLNENVNARSSFPAPVAGHVGAACPAPSSLHGVPVCSAHSQLPASFQNPVQPLPLQPVVAQPHAPAPTAAKVVSLLPPLQVIQMAHPPGATDPSSPNSQKLIILQPANASSPAMVRGALHSQRQGQQIVIIQAAGQNPVSVVPPPGNSRAAPSLDTGQVGCSSGSQSTASIQTVGGKHLVHILPRPVSASASAPSSSQSVAASAPSTPQKTISVNGQLFALQPVRQAGGSSHTTMHVIQPTTSADPHTNVALNAFGALTSLSQSVSQMAGSRAMPTAQSTASTGSSGQIPCAPVITVSSSNPSSLPTPAPAPTPSRPSHGALQPSKSKKTPKKLLPAKQGLPRKGCASGHKPRDCAPSRQPSPSERVSPAECSAAPPPSFTHHIPAGAAAISTSPEPAPIRPPALSATEDAAEGPSESSTPLAAPSTPTCLATDGVCAVTNTAPSPPQCPTSPLPGTGELAAREFQVATAAPCGISSVSQQLESLAAAQCQGCGDARGAEQGGMSSPPSPCRQPREAGPSGDQLPLCTPEHESAGAPAGTQRHTDSPMSSSSGSGRGFSVASLLPDSAREDCTFNAYSLPDHSDIVALAARAIFEQESPEKGAAAEDAVPKPEKQKPLSADKDKARDSSLQPEHDIGVEGRVQESVLPAQGQTGVTTHTSSAQEMPSLACPALPPSNPGVRSLGHSCTPLAGEPANAPATYPEQVDHAAEYPARPPPQPPVGPKQITEVRKDATKRNGPADHLISTAKRQKQCPSGAVRPDGKPGPSALVESPCEREQPFLVQLPVSSSSAPHGHNLGTLFPAANLLGSGSVPMPRSAEGHCGGMPAGQLAQQHGLAQANGSAQGGVPLAHGHSYYKHPQGQLRERHLYQLQQQQHLPHAESPAHGVPQDTQLQKKRGLVRTGQTLALPQKQQGGGSGHSRHKGTPQPQPPLLLQHCFGGAHPEKRCENSVGNRNPHPQSLHGPDLLPHQDGGRCGPSTEQAAGHSRIQRLLTSRSLEQQLAPKGSPASRPPELQCPPHRPERNRISSYSAEALIGKPSSTMQSPRSSAEQPELRTYLDLSMNKSLPVHGLQSKLSLDHCMATDVADCPPFKAGVSAQSVSTFEAQSSRGSEMGGGMAGHRGIPAHSFRLAQGAGVERQGRLPYLPVQGISAAGGASLRDGEGSCHQSFMQGLLPPPLGEQLGGGQRSGPDHARSTQCTPVASIEYSCAPLREAVQSRDGCDLSLGTLGPRGITYPNPPSVPEIQSRNSSPGAAPQKATLGAGNKCHTSPQVSNPHGGLRAALGHGTERPHSLQASSTVSQRARHPAHGSSAGKLRQSDRPRSGNHRSAEVLERSLQLPLPSGGGVVLARQQPSTSRNASIVRFVADGQQVPNENLAPEQHSLSQSFGFPFIAEGGMNPPLNANPPFIPPVTQPGANRTPTLIPVEPQNPLPSFYPSYSPAHPTLSNDLSIPYFSNQIFTSPSTEKASNPFGSILSPPRPVGFPQPSFPLLPDIPARPMANSSSITPHLSNFNLTTLFPEIATAPLTADTPAMPMSPLLPLTNPALSDVSKQHSNRSAHNISHILGHDGSSAV
ncbi:basic helix-loop-helix domain-containing protein USF3 [Mobula birostris]|uniref:basic helix-loop-helix domain-containing protein USF3 n=1 Tax=Mobula birostris TaxID=1983395 RepID=UPI003B280C2E